MIQNLQIKFMIKNANTPLFSLDVKIGGKEMSVPVFEKDSHDSLVQRFCDEHLVKQDYKQTVKDKIIENLLHILKQGKIQEQTKQKISTFLSKDGTKPETIRSAKLQSKRSAKPQSIKSAKQQSKRSATKIETKVTSVQKQNNFKSDKETPYKQISLSNVKSSLKKSSPNRHRHGDCGIEADKKCIRRNKVSFLNQSKNIPTIPSNKKTDSQLVKAYETIFKKAKDPHMKSMAKKFLQDCGHLKSENKADILKPKRIINTSLDIGYKYADKGAKMNEPSLSKVQKYDLSIERYELVDNSHDQQKGVNDLRRKMKTAGSRNRIKYYAEDDPSMEKLVCTQIYGGQQNYGYGTLPNRVSSSRARVSMSYDRLPYCNSQNDQSLIHQRKYDSFYEGSSVLANSRRPKKFNYL